MRDDKQNKNNNKSNRFNSKIKGESKQISFNIHKNTYRPVLTQKDFYPPEDDRCLISGVDDIRGGDNFADYVEYYFETYMEED